MKRSLHTPPAQQTTRFPPRRFVPLSPEAIKAIADKAEQASLAARKAERAREKKERKGARKPRNSRMVSNAEALAIHRDIYAEIKEVLDKLSKSTPSP
jgi:hypothetical protein